MRESLGRTQPESQTVRCNRVGLAGLILREGGCGTFEEMDERRLLQQKKTSPYAGASGASVLGVSEEREKVIRTPAVPPYNTNITLQSTIQYHHNTVVYNTLLT